MLCPSLRQNSAKVSELVADGLYPDLLKLEFGPWFQQGWDLRFSLASTFILGSAIGTTWEVNVYAGFSFVFLYTP